MKLSLNSRHVGEVTVITCGGRIVAGAESASLDDHVNKLLPLNRLIVLHLGEVGFVDSSGIGLLVRLLTRVRTAGGDFKLCNLDPNLVHTLKITNLSTLFETHPSETEAISAIYRRTRRETGEDHPRTAVLCVHESADVLAYLRELLRSAGYHPLTASNPYDALILLKAVAPKLLIHDLNLRDVRATRSSEALRAALQTIPSVALKREFSTSDAAVAARQLLETVRLRLAD